MFPVSSWVILYAHDSHSWDLAQTCYSTVVKEVFRSFLRLIVWSIKFKKNLKKRRKKIHLSFSKLKVMSLLSLRRLSPFLLNLNFSLMWYKTKKSRTFPYLRGWKHVFMKNHLLQLSLVFFFFYIIRLYLYSFIQLRHGYFRM